MPHSESPETTETLDRDMAVDVEPETAAVGEKEASEAAGEEAQNGDSTEQDITMAEAIPIEAPKKDVAVKAEGRSGGNLDDLFADMDSDEEFPSSAPGSEPKVESSPEAPGSPLNIGPLSRASDPEVMRSFYQRLFPWRYLFQWLNHSPTPSTDFGHREFAFTLSNDAYLRYQSFPTADLLRKDVLRLNPSRFEIGPVYSTNPRDRKTLVRSKTMKPISKELCFDIDLTDYDDIRTCCDKANICEKCWVFITMAIKVVDVALREDFGFRHILWVYSGRRGAHAWVCDRKARGMDDQRRRAIAGYLEIIKGGSQGGKKVNVRRPLHPHVKRSLDILRTHFQGDILQAQDPWETESQCSRLLDLLPDRTLNDALRKKWSSAPHRSSTSKWNDIDALAKTGTSKSLDTSALRDAKQDIILEYSYPRLDIEVSKKLNHLLKSPFVVHPGTGRVCVPINTKRCEEFNPLEVPTVTDLLREIDDWTAPEGGEGEGESATRVVQDWEKTSLKPYVEYFRKFVGALMNDEKDLKIKREREEGSMEF